MYTNIRGIKGKKASLATILQQQEPHVFLLTETQLRSDLTINFKGYTFYHRKREGKIGGGVGILIRNDFRQNTAPHISDRPIEIMWISLSRKNLPPLIIGCYYGKQESRTNKNEIEQEMTLLTEEIEEMKREGEIILAMDGNAKLGLLGEQISCNGKLLRKVFDETGLRILNENDKCQGKVTRTNTKNDKENSAIDFIISTETAEKWMIDMHIDEDGLYKIKGKNETDHNTILLNFNIKGTEKVKTVKKTTWNVRASLDKWEQYKCELNKRYEKATKIITDQSVNIQKRYKLWSQEIENAARKTIGKTTLKEGKKEASSEEVQLLNMQKKELKTQIQKEADKTKKTALLNEYKEVQEKTKQVIVKERAEIINKKFEKMTQENDRNIMWKEKKIATRNPINEATIIKDLQGKRMFEPEMIKQHTAIHYENLYKNRPFEYHPYHTEVQHKIEQYSLDRNFENDYYNSNPSHQEIEDIVLKKKNGKSTTDFKNEMLKFPGEIMIDFLYPLVKTIWKEEQIPEQWNKGHITSLYKGKGDKENLMNHRPITTSSSIGTIIETLVDRRIERIVPFTQAQGGGKRNSSTYDHLFLLRAIIDLSKTDKTPTFFTFLDIQKAYDNVNNNDMLTIIWEKGIRGKTWRILNNLCKDLKAHVKTRFGPTRTFDMEIGGRQGSRITGRLFSKMMDIIAEEIATTNIGYKLSDDLTIAMLLWVDDLLSCTTGDTNQKQMLNHINEFALKHRLIWGQSKCKIMRIGHHRKNDNKEEWKLGKMTIEETDQYRYLGDIITADGKNKVNIETRKNKTIATTIQINSIASTEVLKQIESMVLLELHDKITIPGLLANSESWILNKGETNELEKIELQALRNLFDLPCHTPNPAILFTFGTIYTDLRMEKKRLMYLYRILTRDDTNWTKMTLSIMDNRGIGWAKSIRQTLQQLNLPTDFTTIKQYRPNEWKKRVEEKIEIRNKERLLEDCYKETNGTKMKKTKTKHIVDEIEEEDYIRQPAKILTHLNKQQTKTLMIARFHMLECGGNFKGSLSETCQVCKMTDDEDHRLNYCNKFRQTNNADGNEKIPFENVYSTDIVTVKRIIESIEKTWNTRNAHGTMTT